MMVFLISIIHSTIYIINQTNTISKLLLMDIILLFNIWIHVKNKRYDEEIRTYSTHNRLGE